MKSIWVFSLSLAIIFLSCIVVEAAPALSWEQTFGEGRGDSVQETEDGGYIVAGTQLVKTDPYGNELWSIDLHSFSYSVQQTSDGGYIVSGPKFLGIGDYDVILSKINADGNLLWQRTFGGNFDDQGRSVRQTADGGYIIVGYTTSFGAGFSDVYLIKTDADGNELWSKTFGGGLLDYGNSIQVTEDGGFIIAGYTTSFGVGASDVYLIKTDADGNEIWHRTFGGEGDDFGYSVKQIPGGGYIIAGHTGSFGAGFYDVYLIKTNASGNELWSKTFGGSGYDWGYAVDRCSDGGYIIAGETKPLSYSNAYLIKMDSKGVEIWSKQFGGSYSYDLIDSLNDSARSVQQTSDGGYIVAGYIGGFSSGSLIIPPNMYLLKLEPDTEESDTEVDGGGNSGNSIGCFINTAAHGLLRAR